MTYTTTQLITRAYYLSGIVARDFQTVTGDQLTDGLTMLNALLDVKAGQQRFIPYFSVYDFSSVVGQENYTITNLLSVETLTFAIGPVRYSMLPMPRKSYYGSGRVNNLQSLSFTYHVERCHDGSIISLYPLPQNIYAMQLTGKFSLADVILGQDLSATLDLFYIEYLRYGLAEYICNEYNVEFQNASKLLEYENMISDISPLDLTMTKLSTMQKETGINYGFVNLSGGWVP